MRPDHPPRRPDPVQALLWILGAFLAAAVIGVVVYKTWPLLHPVAAERAALRLDCDLRAEPCTVSFASGGQVTLDIEPRGIPAVEPLTIDVRLDGLASPERIEVDFAGVDMDMGFNRAALAPVADADGTQHFRGNGMLPVCVRERMTWEARVLLYYPEGLRAAPFRFDSLRPGANASRAATAGDLACRRA